MQSFLFVQVGRIEAIVPGFLAERNEIEIIMGWRFTGVSGGKPWQSIGWN